MDYRAQKSVEPPAAARYHAFMTTVLSIREMAAACASRDTAYDGLFFIGVRTTGIFCRPSCPARQPLVKNREFFAAAAEALAAGYRPCKRCRPLDATGRHPAWVQRLLSQIEGGSAGRVTDKQIRQLGLEPTRARRYFLKHFGMTFQAFSRGRRMTEALQQIRSGADLDQVALSNGYESPSGFREAFVRTFGQSPGRSRSADCVLLSWAESPLGPLVLGATGKGICLLEFTEPARLDAQFAALQKRFNCATAPGQNRHLEQIKDELKRYFAGELTRFDVPLAYRGTPFQERVWQGLLKIPYGETRSYEDLAQAIGAPGAQRAVGAANGRNCVAIVIPCHRVVNKGGKLGGYGGGLWRKRYLLDLEQHAP